jgi:hypothetical protein
MRNYGPQFFFSLLIVAAVLSLACGSSSQNHLLQSTTVSPATADAQQFPNGQVQFTATGQYTTQPSPVTPLETSWGVCHNGAGTTDVSINSSTGVAQCSAGASGTYTVFTVNPSNPRGPNCMAITACGGGCFVTGTAQLKCP